MCIFELIIDFIFVFVDLCILVDIYCGVIIWGVLVIEDWVRGIDEWMCEDC